MGTGEVSTSIEVREYLDFIAGQTLMVDPRMQGFGLSERRILDAYANKFFILSGQDGLFISPEPIPEKLQGYYNELGINVAKPTNTLSVNTRRSDTDSLISASKESQHIIAALTERQRGFVIPYMTTSDVEAFVSDYNQQLLTSAETVNSLGDKAKFQKILHILNGDIAQHTGFNIAIPSALVRVGAHRDIERRYIEISEHGAKRVVIVKPKSASALGIFILQEGQGISNLYSILDEHFDQDEEVLLEEYVEHNHNPSMQGVKAPDLNYQHLYFGRQIIVLEEGRISYDSSQIPFESGLVTVRNRDIGRMRDLHQALGETLLQRRGINGIVGFDALASIQADGEITTLKLTELNLHLPSSLATYAAVTKLFPQGFTGIAHNTNVPLHAGQTAAQYMDELDALVRSQNQYGIFPLNLSYSDRIDVVVMAKSPAQLEQLVEGL